MLGELLRHGDGGCHGYEISQATGVPSGTLYPMLARLAAGGLTTSYLEQGDPIEMRRPRRRYHRLTADGVAVALAPVERPASIWTVTRPVNG